MTVPPTTKPQWAEIVTGKKTYQLKFLAAKILLGSLVRTVCKDPSPAKISAGVDKLHGLFAKNSTLPSVQTDLKTIFG
jgi:hypothetical protein